MATSTSASPAAPLILFPHQLILRSRENQAQPSSSAAATASTTTASTNSTNPGPFDCNICFSQAEDPVVTCCGHLYCWPCLFTWVRRISCCAVCRGLLRPDLVYPIYGASGDSQQHNGDRYSKMHSIPRRPLGRRIIPPEQ